MSDEYDYKKADANAAEHYIMDGDQTVAVYENAAVKYWNILAGGVVGRIESGSGSKFYYLRDHLGSTRAVVDAAGNVKEALDYYPFGLLMPGRIYQSGSETKEKFIGKELDIETGWYNLGARPYIPALGRFPTIDPLWELSPGKTPYHYSSNDPINRLDPTGLQDVDDQDEEEVEIWDLTDEDLIEPVVVEAEAYQPAKPGTATLAAAWAVAIGEPTPVGEIIVGIGTLWVLHQIYKQSPSGAKSKDASLKEAPSKSKSKIWQKLKPFRGKTKTNGKTGKKRRYYEWDHTHNDIEVYDHTGKHLGSMDPNTGKMIKPPKPGRKITI